MSQNANEVVRELLTAGRINDVVMLLRKLDLPTAAEVLAKAPYEDQRAIFRALPIDLAAAIVSRFPYYHEYVLLHSRPTKEIRAIIDTIDPTERMRFLDELPEEAWQRLMDELSGTTIEAPIQSDVARVSEAAGLRPAKSAEYIIEARDIEKQFQQPDGRQIQVIAPLDIYVESDAIIALLGPSGSGKSTLLRILSGLAQASAGTVLWHGKPLADAHPNVAIVFQSFALFPWLTVLENVEAPLIARGEQHKARHRRALHALSSVGLRGFENAYPKELSGGMKQRVGFARALAVEPEVLFMDEPFSALDVLTAENLRSELLDLWLENKMGIKTIFIVTHNIEEAVLLADRVIVLGRNPAHIRADFRVSLPQPRDRKSAPFVVYVDYIYKVMTSPDAVAAPPAPGKTHEPARYPLLPHARPGGIAGLLEILIDAGGAEDLYHLAEKLLMEVDDLFPIVEAATLLGFAELKEGDVDITPAGRAWVEADIDTQRRLFREAALSRILLFQQIDKVLREKSDHSIPLELFRDILDEHQPEEEIQRQLETVLTWGRYCDLFQYDSEEQRLYLPVAAGADADTDNPEFPAQQS